jgi:hypothetical protein
MLFPKKNPPPFSPKGMESAKVCVVRVIMFGCVVGKPYRLMPGNHFVGWKRIASVFLADTTIAPICAKIFCDESGVWQLEHYDDNRKSQRVLIDYQQVRISPAHQLLFQFE